MAEKALPPTLTEAEITRLLQQVYGMVGTCKSLVSYDDQNLLVTVENDAYILKISNRSEDEIFLQFQNDILQHLAQNAPHLTVPRVIKSLDGKAITTTQKDGHNHHVRLLTYLDGRLLADVPCSDALLHDLGRFMGMFSKAMLGFTSKLPYVPNEDWNHDKVGLVRRKVGSIQKPEDRALITKYFDHYDTCVAPRLDGLRTATLHHDANDMNVLVDAGDALTQGAMRVSGLIDFGDALEGRQINELAVTVGYGMLHDRAPLHAATSIIKGYVSVFPITEQEASVVMELAVMRLVASVTHSSHRMLALPDNDYITMTQKPSYAVLRALDKLSLDDVRAVGLSAAGY